jgi:CO/xanthine dehydrogenase FAD-binding subunit
MIIKFKPNDLEECLMGLPLSNWMMVDEEKFEETFQKTGSSRPRMMVSHIEELQGLTKRDGKIHVKGYTLLKDILKNDSVPQYVKDVLSVGKTTSIVSYETLGSYLTLDVFNRVIHPLFVALDTEFILKSYMKDRQLDFRQYTMTNHLSYTNYNEILFEVIFPIKKLDAYSFNVIDLGNRFPEIETTFSYFLGVYSDAFEIDRICFALMLPNKRVIRLKEMEEVILRNDMQLTSYLELELLKLYNTATHSLRVQLKQRKMERELFDMVIWQPLCKLLKG